MTLTSPQRCANGLGAVFDSGCSRLWLRCRAQSSLCDVEPGVVRSDAGVKKPRSLARAKLLRCLSMRFPVSLRVSVHVSVLGLAAALVKNSPIRSCQTLLHRPRGTNRELGGFYSVDGTRRPPCILSVDSSVAPVIQDGMSLNFERTKRVI